MRIVRIEGVDHLILPATGRDVTDEMTSFADRFPDTLPPVDGFILKGGSPTSGTSHVRVYPSAEKPMAIERSAGFFAREVLKRFSYLPVEDELRLNNARIRDHFLTSIFTRAGFREMEVTLDHKALARFHAANKFVLMACNQKLMHEMGQWVAHRAQYEPETLFVHYREMLCAALTGIPRYTNNINVLQHAFGHFHNRVTTEEKEYCLRLIERYKKRPCHPCRTPGSALVVGDTVPGVRSHGPDLFCTVSVRSCRPARRILQSEAGIYGRAENTSCS